MEKIIQFVADGLKLSFFVGCVGSLVAYLCEILMNKKRTKIWGFDFIVMVVHLFIGGVVGYFVGTALPPGSENRDMIIGISGGASFPIFKFLEANGSSILNKIADKIKDKI